MEFVSKEWLGQWDNFEDYIDSADPYMILVWKEAEEVAKKMPMFLGGVKEFWKKACNTITAENSGRLTGCEIEESKNAEMGLTIEWFAEAGKSLGKYHYEVEKVVEKGLEGKENFLFYAEDAPEGSSFRYLLSMPPMPERSARLQGGYLSHFHFQFADREEALIKEGRLVNPGWYATLCAGEGELLEKCNIVRGLHHLPLWEELPELQET